MLSTHIQMAAAVFFVAAIHLTHAAEFQWIRNTVDYQSAGRRLDGHVVATYDNVFTVTQCAHRCQLLGACASYNFRSALRRCEINSESHVTRPDDVIDSDESQYFKRDAFTIDQTAVGPCGSSPCQNSGTCLTTSSTDGTLAALCLCADGWTGPDCSQTAASLPRWGDWSDWGTCSSSCGDGVKTRTRPCVDQATGQTVSSQLCYGRDQEQMYCKGLSCPAWSEYSEWGECSTDDSCGRGVKARTRTCTNGGTPGVDRLCKGPTNQTTVCTSPKCDASVRLVGASTYGEGRVNIYNDVTDQWMAVCATGWTKANADVVCHQLGFTSGAAQDFAGDYGTEPGARVAMSQVRCQGNEASLATCPHGSWHDTTCAGGPHAGVKCIVNGRWGPWDDWGQCSVTCGEGTSTRTRQCDWPAAQRGGAPCSGDATESKPCTMTPCPVDATWSDWTDWSVCSLTCGGGTQSRSRTCTRALHGGRDCVGEATETQACKEQPCPVDGVWGDWSLYSSCDVTCGGGIRVRTRECTGPFHGGRPCVGEARDQLTCNDNPCLKATWTAWNGWSACTLTCGGGTQSRSRTCTPGSDGSTDCVGEATETQACSEQACPVDGTWSDWTDWSVCSLTCGAGTQSRSRTCTPPLHGGKDCVGQASETQACSQDPCPVDGKFSDWSDWDACSVTCGNGTHSRRRQCIPPQHGGNPCVGDTVETQACFDRFCPVDGVWGDWSLFGSCDVTCGGGVRVRTRECTGPFHGGQPCDGDARDEMRCNEKACP